MRPWRVLAARIRALMHRDAVAGEIREELRFHFESRAEQYEREGLTPGEARQKAARRVGSLALHEDRGYDVRGGGVMETIWQDVRYATRLLRRQPGFTAVAIVTLALGIGASTAIFSVIDAAFLRPLPYPSPEQLVEINVELPRPDRPQPSLLGPSIADIRAFERDDSPISAVTTWTNVMFNRVVDGPEPERVAAMTISATYLGLHGIAPILGRDFNADDTREGAPPVVLLGYGFWQRRFGANPDVVGQTIRYDGAPVTIVGVVPARAGSTPIFTPLQVAPAWEAMRGSGRSTYARLKPGVTLAQAEDQLSAMLPRSVGEPNAAQPERVRLESLLEDRIAGYRTTVNVLAGAVGLILLIACVNVAGLLLARGATRHAELAVRASIGAGRLRLVRQLLTESLVLSVAGGLLGVLVAWLTLDALVANIPMSLPSNSPAVVNGKVLAASLGLALTTGILFGLIPAFRLSRVRIGAALARGSRGHGTTLSRRGGRLLIGAEIALAVVLVAGAGLMIRSFARVMAVDMGFDPDNLVTLEAMPLDADPSVHGQFYAALLARLRTMPGIAAAGAVDHMPLAGSSTMTGANVGGKSHSVSTRQMLPGYFEAIGMTLRQGRLPTDADVAAGFPGVVINETAARTIFGVEPAMGRQMVIAKTDYTVVGVVADVRHGGPFGRTLTEVFMPFKPSTDRLHQARALTFVIRPNGEVPNLAAALRDAARSAGPRVLVERIRTGTDWLGDRVVTPRKRTVLLGLLGSLGLVLAVVGVFGMTAYSVARRTQEIGVRMAFGARPVAMVRLMLRDAVMPVAIGTVVGLICAAFATKLIATFLFQTDPIDVGTFAVVALVLVAAGTVAALVPATRAARIDPVTALRSD